MDEVHFPGWQPEKSIQVIRRADRSLGTAADTVRVTTDDGPAYLKALGSARVDQVWSDLSQLASGATCLMGHNLIRHDLPILRQHAHIVCVEPCALPHLHGGSFGRDFH